MTAWEKEGQCLAEERKHQEKRAVGVPRQGGSPYSIPPPQHCWSFFPCPPSARHILKHSPSVHW